MGNILVTRCLFCFVLLCVCLTLFWLPPARAGLSTHVLITEVFYDTPGTESQEEWVEIFNPTKEQVDISGWKITDGEATFTVPNGTIMPAQEVLIVARSSSGFKALYGFEPDFSGATFSLSNSGDEVILKDSSNNVVDVVTYGKGSYPGVIPHPAVTEGHSLERVLANFDTDDCSRDLIDQPDEMPGQVTLDTTPPKAEASEDKVVDEDKEVTFTASASTDDGLIVDYNWSFGDGTSGAGEVASHVYPEPGAYQVKLSVADEQNNIGEDSCTVTVRDITPPNGSIQINGGSPITNSPIVSLSLTASDNRGATEMMLANTADLAGAGWEKIGSPRSWELTSGDGEKAVCVRFKDAAGNESTVCSASIILDTNPPRLTSLNINEGQTVSGIFLIKVEPSDTNGIRKVDLYIDDELRSTSTAAPYEYNWDTTDSHSTHTVKITAVDVAGNSTTVSRHVEVRNLPYTDGTHLILLFSAGSVTLVSGLVLRRCVFKIPNPTHQ